MGSGIVNAVIASVAGISMAAYLGLTATSNAMLSRHILIGIFSTMICLLSHSMMMFYFLGKGKAVKEAAAEGGLSKEFERRIAVLRKPVFSIGTYAMLLTIVAGLLGASVDTGMLPAGVHGVIAYSCLALNLMAFVWKLARSERAQGRCGSESAAECLKPLPRSSCTTSKKPTARCGRCASATSKSNPARAPR